VTVVMQSWVTAAVKQTRNKKSVQKITRSVMKFKFKFGNTGMLNVFSRFVKSAEYFKCLLLNANLW